MSELIRHKSRNRQFWLLYAAAWLAYGASLGAVFVSGGSRFDAGLPVTIVCNVLPAALLGILVVQICRRLKWSERKQPRFFSIHILSLVLFAASWCFLTLLGLSVVYFLQSGAWVFLHWGGYAVQWQLFSGVMAYLTIASAVYVKQTEENLRAEEQLSAELRLRAASAEAARASAELAAIRARLNPHFLFNTLHSLMALVRTDADTAEAAIERFALMLRYVLQSQGESRAAAKAADVTFGEEWDFVQNYLELERLRLGDRLKLTTEIEPAALRYQLPAFTLQPIVENAVKYGVAPRANGGRIFISARSDNGNLIVKVCDDGDGKSSASGRNGSGLGLRLVRESLAARFGAAANLKTESAPSEGFKVSLTIPRVNSSEGVFKAPEIERQNLC